MGGARVGEAKNRRFFYRIGSLGGGGMGAAGALPGRKAVSAEGRSAAAEPKTEPRAAIITPSSGARAGAACQEAHQVRGTIRDLVATP
ncbi:hypothetical protein ES708_10263 [subsurface metagenome]